ncbi:MAG: hypothetical protein ACP5KN_07065 [Armatimonadota bacterium]
MMRRGLWVIVSLVLISAGAGYWLLLRPEPVSDEMQVIRLIADVERAVEQKDVSGLMQHISHDYEDERGYTRRLVQRLVLAGARDPRTIDLSVDVSDVDVQGDRATFVAEVDYFVDGSVAAGASQHLTVVGNLRKEGRRWRVVSADGWQQAEHSY